MDIVQAQINTHSYQFTETQDWFSFNVDNWRNLFKHVRSVEPRVLEIGSWEGRSAVFLSTELCRDGGEVVCIDHFDLMNTEAGRERHRKLTYNLSLTDKRFRILDEFSVVGLMSLLKEEISSKDPGFDWIYVDGSHEADDTFLDGELAWRLARKGAVLIFDDYRWDKEPEESIHHPKRGIDAFLALHAGEFTKLSSDSEYQVVLKKEVDMRIGFLVKDTFEVGEKRTEDAFGYGINVALTIDEGYAIAAAVAIRSAVAHTTGRITVYVVGRDLSDDTKDRLRQSVKDGRADATLVFIDLHDPPNPLPATVGFPTGVTWAKISMIPLLPVERVLYLDADVLVRDNLRELWDTNLEGKAIAAAPDVGLPAGHDAEGVNGFPYFNAGVLLIDLANIRRRSNELYMRAAQMKDYKFQDQDALNAHFRGGWRPLSLRWNAQGLGTYSRYHMPERAALSLQEMDDPAIVHFTGALHPSLAEFTNPFVQPCTAKPWGYAGAPGHPYAEDWWAVCEETAWRGWKSSTEYKELRARVVEDIISTGVEHFRRKLAEGREDGDAESCLVHDDYV